MDQLSCCVAPALIRALTGPLEVRQGEAQSFKKMGIIPLTHVARPSL